MQRRHVGARHEQHEADASEQREQGRARRAEHGFGERRHDRRDPRRLVLLPVVARRVGRQVAARLRERHAGLEPAEGAHPPHARLLRELADARYERRPQLGSGGIGEAPRHHAHDRERLAIEHDRGADDAGVRREALAPQRVAEHDHARGAPPIVLGHERAPERRRHAEHGEEAPGDEPTHELDGLAAAAHRPGLVRARQAGHVFERGVARPPVAERRVRHLDERLAAVAVTLPDERQAIGLGVGKRPQDHGVRHAEDRDGTADPDGERRRRDQREDGPSSQPSRGVRQIPTERTHKPPLPGRRVVPLSSSAQRRGERNLAQPLPEFPGRCGILTPERPAENHPGRPTPFSPGSSARSLPRSAGA